MTTAKLVIVVGKASSGKTTLSRSLVEYGYTYVSASDVLSSTLGIKNVNHGKHSLAERGSSARGTPDLATFHNALRQRIADTNNDAVLDGPRFAETIKAIRPSAPHSLVVYLDCPDSIRKQRLTVEGRSSDWVWLEKHPTETSVTEIRELADIILDGAQPAPAVLQSLKSRLLLMNT